MKRCKYCNSIWVCWNWIHAKNFWIHECWDCGDGIAGSCFETKEKVKNGISYWVLRNFHKYFDKKVKE